MTHTEALLTIIRLYDSDYPADLRAAGHHAKAYWLESVSELLVDGCTWSDPAVAKNIELAKFMQLCSEQRDGS
jgi:hypothetical protein